MNMNIMGLTLAMLARRKGAKTADILSLIMPLSGSAATVLNAVTLLRNQREQDELSEQVHDNLKEEATIEKDTPLDRLQKRYAVRQLHRG